MIGARSGCPCTRRKRRRRREACGHSRTQHTRQSRREAAVCPSLVFSSQTQHQLISIKLKWIKCRRAAGFHYVHMSDQAQLDSHLECRVKVHLNDWNQQNHWLNTFLLSRWRCPNQRKSVGPVLVYGVNVDVGYLITDWATHVQHWGSQSRLPQRHQHW